LIIVACIIIALSCILFHVRVKFVEISFDDEFINYSPCFLLHYSYGLDHGLYGLGPKEREVLCHNVLVTAHACSVMVFVSPIVMSFNWIVSTPILR
jgi:hypothetical protein